MKIELSESVSLVVYVHIHAYHLVSCNYKLCQELLNLNQRNAALSEIFSLYDFDSRQAVLRWHCSPAEFIVRCSSFGV